jgi:hypothetical protein
VGPDILLNLFGGEPAFSGRDLHAGKLGFADELMDSLGADTQYLTHFFSFPKMSELICAHFRCHFLVSGNSCDDLFYWL